MLAWRPPTLAPALGVGARGLKNDRRDAAVLSAASCRVELPSVHIRSRQSRALQSRLGLRDAAVRARTGLLNVVHSHLRTIGERVRSGASQTLVERVRDRLGERAAVLETVFASIESLNITVAAMTKGLRTEAKHDELADRLQSVPGVGPLVAMRYIATVDQIGRFENASAVTCYMGLVPSEHSSGECPHRGGITKAGSPVMRALSKPPGRLCAADGPILCSNGYGASPYVGERKSLSSHWRERSPASCSRFGATAPDIGRRRRLQWCRRSPRCHAVGLLKARSAPACKSSPSTHPAKTERRAAEYFSQVHYPTPRGPARTDRGYSRDQRSVVCPATPPSRQSDCGVLNGLPTLRRPADLAIPSAGHHERE